MEVRPNKSRITKRIPKDMLSNCLIFKVEILFFMIKSLVNFMFFITYRSSEYID